MAAESVLCVRHELAFRTQYTELTERSRTEWPLLPGTPGTPGSLALRAGTGYGCWYRRIYVAGGQQAETLVCKDGDAPALDAMRERIALAEWSRRQVPTWCRCPSRSGTRKPYRGSTTCWPTRGRPTCWPVRNACRFVCRIHPANPS